MQALSRVPGRSVVGRSLLIIAAVAAALTAIDASAALGSAASGSSLLLAWRALGFGVFAGLFALVAWRPTAYPGVLELGIAHKAGMTLLALAWPQATDAATVAVADGLLTVALVSAYVLLRSHRSWRLPAPSDGSDRPAAPAGTRVTAA